MTVTDHIMCLFRGREDVYALQLESGAYIPKREPVTGAVIDKHLSHEYTVGVYLVRPDTDGGTVSWLCFDLDGENARKESELIWTAALRCGAHPSAMLYEYSGGKGYHVHVFLADWWPVTDMRRWMQRVQQTAGVQCEAFPKGTVAPGGLGNLCKLPLAFHRKSRRTSVLSPTPSLITRPEEALENTRHLTRREVEYMLAQIPPEPERKPSGRNTTDDRLWPCVRHIIEEGQEEGGRDRALYSLALGHRLKGRDEGEAVESARLANERFQPPLPDYQVRQKVRSAYTAADPKWNCALEHLHDGAEPHCAVFCPRYQPEYGRARAKIGARNAT